MRIALITPWNKQTPVAGIWRSVAMSDAVVVVDHEACSRSAVAMAAIGIALHKGKRICVRTVGRREAA